MKTLAELQPGDEVAWICRSNAFFPINCRVVRLTKTQIIVGRNRYSKETGMQIGCRNFYTPRIEPWCEKHDLNFREHEATKDRRKATEQIKALAYDCKDSAKLKGAIEALS